MGAHAIVALVRPPPSHSLLFEILSLLMIITCIGRQVTAITEAEALLKFKSSLTNKEAFPGWNPSSSPCSGGRTSKWHGVICAKGKVWGLRLEHMGLEGTIDVNALSQLPELRTLSFKNNKFEGAIPEFHLLPKLRSFYLTNNRFSGEIPENAFSGMDALRRVILTRNAFTGKIPSSLATLPILVELKLDNNQFQGSIPDFQQKTLPNINVANNQLEGASSAIVSTTSSPGASPNNQQIDRQTKELFLTFRCFCTRKDIRCIDVMLRDNDVGRALVEYANYAAIENLVIGASRGGFIRKFSKADVPTIVAKGAPDFCTVYVISKSKVSNVRNASRPVPHTSPLQNHLESIVKDKPNPNPPAPVSTPPRRSLSIRGERPSSCTPPPSYTPPREDKDFSRSDRLNGRLMSLEFPESDTDISFVSSDRQSVDRLSMQYDYMDSARTPRLSTSSDHSFGSVQFGQRPCLVHTA